MVAGDRLDDILLHVCATTGLDFRAHRRATIEQRLSGYAMEEDRAGMLADA